MRIVLIVVLVLGLVQDLVLGAPTQVYFTLTPTTVDTCYACAYGNTPANNTISWAVLPSSASELLGQIAMPVSANDSISYSEAICCKYLFKPDELGTLGTGTLTSAIFTFNRWAIYNTIEKPHGVLDYAYGFGIYDSSGYELISDLWTLPEDKISTAPRLSSDSKDIYSGNMDTSNTSGNDNLSSSVYIVVGYQIINTAQDANINYLNVSVTLSIEVAANNNGVGVGFGVGFGLGVPVVFLAIFLPVYFCVMKPRMQKKMEAKAMEMGKKYQNDNSNTKYGAISGTTSSTSTGSGSLLGGNYSPLGPTSPDAATSAVKPSGKRDNLNDRFNIPYREITFKSEIGAGGFGKVFMGEWQSTEVAIKVSNNATSNEEFRKEAELMVNIRPHPNVLQVLGVCTDGIAPAIIMEYCPGGSLDLLMFDKSKPVTEEYQFRLILGIARGMLHLHKNNIVHRDLAARNILLSRDGEPKISDFGMSRIIESTIKEGTTRTNVGPIRWMAPESIKSKVYSTKSDVWSFGVVISEILNREEPHKEIEDVIEVAIAIRNELKTPKINPDAPELLKDIMKQCWAINPEERPEMDALCDKLIKYKEQKKL